MDWLKGVAGVVIGWALGAFSASFTEWRRKQKRIRATKNAIRNEFRETAHRLLGMVYLFSERHGRFDRKLLEWMVAQAERYEGPNPKGGILAGAKGLLENTDEQLAAFAKAIQPTVGRKFIPNVSVPYTTAAIANLHDQEPDYAVRALDVLSHLQMFNEARDDGEYFLRLTFAPGLTKANYEVALMRIDGAEQQMLKRGRIIIDKITEFEEVTKPKKRFWQS